MRKIFAFAMCALLLGPMLHSCNENTDRPLLGVALNNPGNDWRTQLATYAAEEASTHAADIDYILRQAPTAADQATQLQALKEAGCEAVVIAPEDDLDPAVVNELIEAGIQVFFCENNLNVNYAGFVTTDNTQQGEKAGEWLAAQTGVTRVACFRISQSQSVSDARLNGFTSKLAGIPSVNVDCAAYSREAGKAAAEALLSDTIYAGVTAVYAQDDEVALGVLDALDEAPGSPVVFVIGCGGSKAFFGEIESRTGIALATTLYSPAMVKSSVDQAVQWLLNGTTPSPKNTYLPVTVVDATNVSTQTPF